MSKLIVIVIVLLVVVIPVALVATLIVVLVRKSSVASSGPALLASDPTTPAAVLGQLATSHPQLRSTIAANPSAYPDLLVWLGQLGDPQVDAVLRARAAAQP